jgi:F-type H+-transporting ATPase subunit b
MSKRLRIFILSVGLLLASGLIYSQSSSSPQPAPAASAEAQQKAPEVNAAKPEHGQPVQTEDEAEENAQFKYDGWAVRGLASMSGLSRQIVYWIFVIINFVVLAGGVVWIIRKILPQGFAPRTAEIQKGIEDARKASAEATARLTEIESRLARLDAEIAEIRGAAETDFSAEEQRIKAAAEQDARNVIAAAEQEIAAAARSAQRELKTFVAELAVEAAAKQIEVDAATDRELVHGFASQLGKDGK